jgi:hypothetical protein
MKGPATVGGFEEPPTERLLLCSAGRAAHCENHQ